MKLKYLILICFIMGLSLISLVPLAYAALPVPTIVDSSHWDVSSNLEDYKLVLPDEKARIQEVCLTPVDSKSLASSVCYTTKESDNSFSIKINDTNETAYIYYTTNKTYQYETDKLELNGFEVEVFCNDEQIKGITWETFNQALNKEVKFNINTNGFGCDGKLTFRQNKLETNCIDTRLGHFCDAIDYSDIENSKENIIDKKEVNPVYASTWEAFLAVFPDLSKIDDYKSVPIAYDINYYGKLNYLDPVTTAVGGTITTYILGGTNYTAHTFTSNGTFNVSSGSGSVEVLIVGGGGGGGSYGGGGAGAGGLIYNSSYGVSVGNNYTIDVGAGGVGAESLKGNGKNGANSSFDTLIAAGGGKGGGGYSIPADKNGGTGGSGGGAASGDGGSGTAGSGISGQGNNGGVSSNTYYGGGGGGAGAAGANGVNPVGGNGGIGSTSNMSGTSTYYAGGGAGAPNGVGGNGGGGNGTSNVNGQSNTGGGGGGDYTSAAGGTGGSGIVIVRYQTQTGGGDTCTYSGSGNWAITCSDNCTLTNNTQVGKNNISIVGAGLIKVNANITNFTNIIISGASQSASGRCYVYCAGGNCFRKQ